MFRLGLFHIGNRFIATSPRPDGDPRLLGGIHLLQTGQHEDRGLSHARLRLTTETRRTPRSMTWAWLKIMKNRRISHFFHGESGSISHDQDWSMARMALSRLAQDIRSQDGLIADWWSFHRWWLWEHFLGRGIATSEYEFLSPQCAVCISQWWEIWEIII